MQVLLNLTILSMNTNTYLSYLAYFFLEGKMCQTKVVEKLETHILCSITFFRRSCILWHNVENVCRAGLATDDNMAHAHCMLDAYGYKQTHRLCSTHCFSTATMVARTRLNVTLYVHCLAVSLGTTRFNIQKFYMALALRWVFCKDLRKDSDLYFIRH
jgi:hypothetical protein